MSIKVLELMSEASAPERVAMTIAILRDPEIKMDAPARESVASFLLGKMNLPPSNADATVCINMQDIADHLRDTGHPDYQGGAKQ